MSSMLKKPKGLKGVTDRCSMCKFYGDLVKGNTLKTRRHWLCTRCGNVVYVEFINE